MSENFGGSVEDAIAIQEQIALTIAQALKTAMDPEALVAMVFAGTRSVGACQALPRSNALFMELIRTGDGTINLARKPSCSGQWRSTPGSVTPMHTAPRAGSISSVRPDRRSA